MDLRNKFMKNLVIFFLCSFSLVNSYSKCFEKTINPDSKYEFVETMIETLSSIQNYETEIYKTRKDEVTNILYVYKKSIIDTECSIQTINTFEQSKKVKIKQSLPVVINYLNSRIRYQKEIINLFNMKNVDMSRLSDKVSDLKIEKDEIDENLSTVVSTIMTSTRYEESDNPKFKIEKIPKEKTIYYLGITSDERRKILDKLNKTFTKDDTNMRILIGLLIPTEFISFTNKELVSLEDIK